MNINSYFKEVQPERGIQGNFASGQINFKWDMGENESWIPKHSYIKIRMSITKGDGSRLDRAFGVAPNMFVCDNLFQQLDMRVNGVVVSEWNDYIAQCAALKYRLSQDMDHRQSLASSVNYAQIYLQDRLNDVASDGTGSESRLVSAPAESRASTFTGAQIDEVADTLALSAAGVFTWVDAAGGDLDLRNTDLKVGQYILYTGFLNNSVAPLGSIPFESIHEITAITQNTLTVSPSPTRTNIAANVANNVNFNLRRAVSDALTQINSNSIELIWKPPIGFFDIRESMYGNYKFELTPHAEGVWQKYAVEAAQDRLIGATVEDISVEITEMNMYLWCRKHEKPYSGQKKIYYSDMRCSSQNLTTNSLTSKEFQISPSNHSLTLAFQDSGVGDDIRLSRSKFRISNDEQNNLVRYYLIKDGITLPNPIPDMEISNGVSRIAQHYYENFAYSGEDLKRKESLKEWLDAGLYFHYKMGRGMGQNHMVSVYTNFSSAFTKNPQILLFDHYHSGVNMTLKDGKVVSVEKM